MKYTRTTIDLQFHNPTFDLYQWELLLYRSWGEKTNYSTEIDTFGNFSISRHITKSSTKEDPLHTFILGEALKFDWVILHASPGFPQVLIISGIIALNFEVRGVIDLSTIATRPSHQNWHAVLSSHLIWPLTFICSLSTSCETVMTQLSLTSSHLSCSLAYMLGVQGATALGKRMRRSAVRLMTLLLITASGSFSMMVNSSCKFSRHMLSLEQQTTCVVTGNSRHLAAAILAQQEDYSRLILQPNFFCFWQQLIVTY